MAIAFGFSYSFGATRVSWQVDALHGHAMASAAVAAPEQAYDEAVQTRPDQELKHRCPGGSQVLKLRLTCDGRKYLEHVITGETVFLDIPGVSLHIAPSGWGYLKAPGRPPEWATRRLSKSVWLTPSKQWYVTWKESDVSGQVHTRRQWLTDLRAARPEFFVKWDVSEVFTSKAVVKVYHVRPRRGGCNYFWNMVDAQTAASFNRPFPRSGKWCNQSMPRWQTWLRKFSVGDEHFLLPYCTGDASFREDYRADGLALSTFSFLGVWLRVATSIEDPQDKNKALGILWGVLKVSLADGEFHLSRHTSVDFGELPSTGSVMKVRRGVLSWEGQEDILPATCNNRHVVDVLQFLCWQKGMEEILKQFLNYLSLNIEDSFAARGWSSDPLEAVRDGRKRKRADSTFLGSVAQVAADGARQQSRVLDVARKSGMKVSKHRSRIDIFHCRLYLMAVWRDVYQRTTFAFAADTSKLRDGRSYLKTSFFNYESGTCFWAPPQALPPRTCAEPRSLPGVQICRSLLRDLCPTSQR